MSKFHVSLKGDVGICKATKRCPFGDMETDHYKSAAMAQRAYELENTLHEVRFSSKHKEILNEIGPRQLPNQAWNTLSKSLTSNRFSELDLEIAVTALADEYQKLATETNKPLHLWGDEGRLAARELANVLNAASEISLKIEQLSEDRHNQLSLEF